MSLIKRVLGARTASGQPRGKGWWIRMAISGLMLALSFAFMVYVVYAGWDSLRAQFSNLNWWLLGAAFLSYPLGFVPVLWGWHVTMSRVGGCSNARTNVRLYSLSCLPKRIPGSIWYIASRVALYRDHETSPALTLAATAMETAWLVLSGMSVYLLSLAASATALDPRLRGIAIAGFVLTCAAPMWAPLLLRGVRWLLARRGMSVEIVLRPGDVLRLLGISGLAWVGGGLVLCVLASAVTRVRPADLPALIGAWAAAGAVSLTAGLLVQGMGLREVTLAVLLGRHMPLPVAAAVSLLFRLLLTVGEFIWALIFSWLATLYPQSP